MQNIHTESTILNLLNRISSDLSEIIYWVDTNGVILGANNAFYKAINAQEGVSFLGKTTYDIYPKELAEKIVKLNEQIMQSGQGGIFEDVIQDLATGKQKVFSSIKSPLYSDSGKLIGLVGISREITNISPIA